jgi:spore coat protein U-like protein
MPHIEKRAARGLIRRLSSLLAGIAGICAILVPSVAWSKVDTCTVAAQTHAFGAYDTINPTSTTSSLTVSCTTDNSPRVISYTVKLSSGPGSYATRQMTGAGDTLTYNLYTTAAHTTIWGDGTAGTSTVSGSVSIPNNSNSASNIETVYGLIGAPQNVTPSAYSTATPITVTVSGPGFSTTTTTFNANASVAAQCSVSAANLSFGTVNPLSSQVDATTALTVQCTKNSPYTVGLDAGTTTGATIAQRKMANGADIMNYNLYTDAARTTIWGNSAVAPLWATGSGTGLGNPQTLTVYGRVAAGQTNLAVGTFLENKITVTLTY